MLMNSDAMVTSRLAVSSACGLVKSSHVTTIDILHHVVVARGNMAENINSDSEESFGPEELEEESDGSQVEVSNTGLTQAYRFEPEYTEEELAQIGEGNAEEDTDDLERLTHTAW